jgi:hypothetical protein
MLAEAVNHTLDIWIRSLDRYSFDQLLSKPSPNRWSIGQVYMHLIENTDYFFEQVRICTSANDDSDKEMSTEGKTMFSNNSFPDEQIEGPPENLSTPQPESKEQLLRSFLALKEELNRIASLTAENQFKGKTRHPGLNYFNALEWLQFADMHLRHHLRQKNRIDIFLEINKDQ